MRAVVTETLQNQSRPSGFHLNPVCLSRLNIGMALHGKYQPFQRLS